MKSGINKLGAIAIIFVKKIKKSSLQKLVIAYNISITSFQKIWTSKMVLPRKKLLVELQILNIKIANLVLREKII